MATRSDSRITPVFRVQHQAATAGKVPSPVRVSTVDGELWVRAVPMPGAGVMNSVLSTVHLGDGGVTVVDPGWAGGKAQDAAANVLRPLDAFLREHGRRLEDVTDVVVTHAHPDHVGAAAEMLGATGARYHLGAVEQRSVDAARTGTSQDDYAVEHHAVGAPDGVLEKFPFSERERRLPPFIPRQRPDVLLQDGDLLPDHGVTGELGWRAVLTPGHTPGHLCFADDARGLLIAADQVLPEIFPGIGLGVGSLGGNPVKDYLASVERLAEFDDYTVIPGHGFCFTGLAERRAETTAHVMERAEEVSRVLEWNPGISVWRLAGRLTWSGGWDSLADSPMVWSAIRQTMMYRDLVLEKA
ncbi:MULTISPECIES: MBL fold metallo-hydrolase [unclassified Corynebacterium]|uniref:MBL fold metallo-hydrolase n=1 Tax=unclassified Corynebacterium TaxID=2624378 RepID=UPI00403351FF